MKRYTPWLLGLLILIAGLGCDDNNGNQYDRTVTETFRTWRTEVVDSLVSGTWTLANSPYYVSSSVAVAAGQTLVIQPGVEVLFERNSSMYVEGTLTAIGTNASPIKFYPVILKEDYGLWQSLVFMPGSDASELKFAIVAYGAKFNNSDPYKNAAIVVDDSSPTIEHCMIYLNQYNGISFMHGALPRFRSNIVHENDGSGVVFDTTHVGTTQLLDWQGDSLFARNNVSRNSSLAFRFPVEMGELQWGVTIYDSVYVADTLNTIDTLVVLDNRFVLGENTYRNENRDKVDVLGNCMDDALFDELNADFQSFNSCSPCIEAGYDVTSAKRSDVGPVLYQASANELRKQIKNSTLTGTWRVTCDAFSSEDVTISPGARLEFAGFYGLEFNGNLNIDGATFDLAPESDWTVTPGTSLSDWRSLLIKPRTDDLSLAGTTQQITATISNSSFARGSESGFSGQNYIQNGGIIELRDTESYYIEGSPTLYQFDADIDLTVSGCDFDHTTYYSVAAHGPGSHATVENCTFTNNGLSALFAGNGASASFTGNRLDGCRFYGVFIYNTPQMALIENNLIMNCDVYGIKVQATPNASILQNTILFNGYGGIKVESQSNPVIRYNMVVGNDYSLSSTATGIVGNQIGASFDTNNPVIDQNWFHDNGAADESFPSNWDVGACNLENQDPQLQGSNWLPASGTIDCGGSVVSVGWNPGEN
ncbi:MAG: right-handed parallel beta-helix repeat-containing protein [Candidatus Cloacimonetes bacterium]|nr:right-handed parallel beta-helix repeat-containing protein [Candidatus Cloacimonadota bacterium]